MKTYRALVLFALLVACQIPVKAQSALDTLKCADLMWSMKKKAVVLSQMKFTEAEKSSFWPVYESYNNATRYLELECLLLMSKYAQSANDCTSNELEDISQRILRNDLQLAKLRKQFYKKFKNAISPRQATAYFQIDNMFRSMIRLEAQRDSDFMEFTLYTRH